MSKDSRVSTTSSSSPPIRVRAVRCHTLDADRFGARHHGCWRRAARRVVRSQVRRARHRAAARDRAVLVMPTVSALIWKNMILSMGLLGASLTLHTQPDPLANRKGTTHSSSEDRDRRQALAPVGPVADHSSRLQVERSRAGSKHSVDSPLFSRFVRRLPMSTGLAPARQGVPPK